MADLLIASFPVCFLFMVIQAVTVNSNELNDVFNTMPGLQLTFRSNKSKELAPSERIQIDFYMKISPSSLGLQNLLLNIEVPYPMLILKSAISEYGNKSESILLNKTSSLNVTYASMVQNTTVSLVLETSESLESQAKLLIKYKIQYIYNTTYKESFFTKALYTRPLHSYLQQSIRIEPNIVEAGDLMNLTITITNKNVTTVAYNLTSQIQMNNTIVSKVSCSDANTTYIGMKTGMISASFGNIKALQNISCSIQWTAGSNIELGGKLKLQSTLSYYNKEPHSNLYPIEDTVVQYVNVSSIIIAANSLSNLSSLQTGDFFKISLTIFIPRSTSLVNVMIRFPTYRIASSSTPGNGSNTSEQYPVIVSSGQNISYNIGSELANETVALIRMLNSSLLNINYGIIKSNGSKNTGNMTASSITMQLILQVANDPLNVYGMRDNIAITVGHSNMQIPFAVTGPSFHPILSVQKSVKILDANRDSPLISFTILIQHTNASTADALDIKVVDYTQNLAIYSSGVSPSGNIEANSNNLYIMTINAVIKRLRVSENATIVYTGAFMKEFQSSYFKRKATASWRSAQVNNAKVFTEYSQEVCLSATKKFVTKYEKSYTMVLLGVVAGIFFGVLLGLLIIFCLRKFKIAKTYVFIDVMEEHAEDEEEGQTINGDENKFILLDILKKPQNGLEPKQKAELQRLNRYSWALMVAAKYDRASAEKSCSRILVELLVHGYDNSFHYFVDGLSQTVSNFARKLRSSGDLSAENLQKIQTGVDQINSTFTQESETLKNQFTSINDNLQEVGRKYLECQCLLIQDTKRNFSNLFHSMFNAPSKIGKEKATEQLEKADEMKGDFIELERSVFIHANGLRAQTYSCVKQTQVSLVGYIYSLIWSQKVFYLWCQWMSKKLRRELNILQRKRCINEKDTEILILNMEYIFKQGEISYEGELHKKAVDLEKNLYFDFWTFFKTLDSELQNQLKVLNVQSSQGASTSHKDSLDVIKQRCDLFANKMKLFLDKSDGHQNEMFARTLDMIKDASSHQLKEITGNIELLVMKYFSNAPRTDKEDHLSQANDVHSLEIESKSRKETMKMILETLEDIQADYNEAQNTNNAILEDFREEIQSARENVQQMVASILQETDRLIDEPIVQCRFQFKSLLYFLRDLSLLKIRSILESWTKHLHLTLTSVYLRKDLKNFAEITSKEMENREDENVIYWFKPICTTTNSEFQKTKRSFADFVEKQANELRELFQDQTECLRNITKDYVFMDLKEDSVNIRKMASLKQEFLIVHQYIVNILNELDDDQQLADPEVRDCFTKFNKVVRSLMTKEDGDDGSAQKLLKQDVRALLRDFKTECEAMQAQPSLGTCGKVEELFYDEDGVIDKIERMIDSKKNRNEKITTLEKLQAENLSLLANLRKIDKIKYPKFMLLVYVLHSNLSKSRFDEILLAIDGDARRDYCSELNSYLANEDRLREQGDNEEKPRLQPGKKKKERKKNKIAKKNAIQPEP